MPIACSSALTPILREFSILQLDVNPDVLQKCVFLLKESSAARWGV